MYTVEWFDLLNQEHRVLETEDKMHAQMAAIVAQSEGLHTLLVYGSPEILASVEGVLKK